MKPAIFAAYCPEKTAESDLTMLTINAAAAWASRFTKKDVTASNITYLLQYGRIRKYQQQNQTLVSLEELRDYYEQHANGMRHKFENALGEDINWDLSFAWVKEAETTKHVHRLHPYKGKFIPQLVEYFLDSHTDSFKREVYFHQGDIILDPFAGSGTTLVQANELGLHSIGLDISYFNCLIAEAKLGSYNPDSILAGCQEVYCCIKREHDSSGIAALERELDELLAGVNRKYFPNDYRYQIAHAGLDEKAAAQAAMHELNRGWQKLLKIYQPVLKDGLAGSDFLDTWYAAPVLKEVLAGRDCLQRFPEAERRLLTVILSRTLRSCRATPHYQLERLETPVFEPYYCYKHKKICRPVLSMAEKFTRYYKDSVRRIREFQAVKTGAYHALIDQDARTADIFAAVRRQNPAFYDLLLKQRIQGIFTSPPYVGQLDYHQQHEYAYELFGFTRRDEEEIGKSSKGKGLKAQEDYVRGISEALINCKRFLTQNSHIFIVANDRHGLYPDIARRAGLEIIQEFKRPVLNRTARDKNPYGESIFHMV
ncbi:MAG: DNA methyltransferase [Bacillota bacterium]|nr:DNA methyltransferase [Bacillota bacterium]